MKHYKEYKLQYCLVCHGLHKNFGFFSSFLLNYECVFLYIFLTSLYPSFDNEKERFQCLNNPIKSLSSKVNRSTLEYASFVNYHLAVLKMDDGAADTNGAKKYLYRIGSYLLKKNSKYKNLCQKNAIMAQKTEQYCQRLYELELEECSDFDLCSNLMGDVLCSIVESYIDKYPIQNKEEVVRFAKHLGMWIYLIDAYDDYDDDMKEKKYNPLSSFSKQNSLDNHDVYAKSSGEAMLGMMIFSLNSIRKNILPNSFSEIIDNILLYGTQNSIQEIKERRRNKNESRKSISR